MAHLNEIFLRKRASEILLDKLENATIFDEEKEKQIPVFSASEIAFGQVLGKGGFCTVSTLAKVTLEDTENRKSQQSQIEEHDFFAVTQDRNFIHSNFLREGKHRYALKKLTPGLLKKQDPQHFVCGVIDLAMEVKFLSVLRHPHIIKMRAIANVNSCSENFFVVLDRLNLTLGEQIKIWKKEVPNGFLPSARQKREDLWHDRLVVGHDICSAFSYLHEKKIIYRDLKPANLGFDVRGDVKLFDFGLATEMIDAKRHKDTNTYLLTKDTGSPRYMAPEVFSGVPHNEKCDVYSFGLILWECLELAQPFNSYDIKKMKMKVYNGRDTPKLNSKWNDKVQKLLKNCWLRDFSKRKSCESITQTIKDVISAYDGDLVGDLDISNRTEMSIRNMTL